MEIERRIVETHDFIAPHVGCLVITPAHSSRPFQMLGSATATLLLVEGRQILVTCSHVYAEFQSLAASNPNTGLALMVAEPDGTYSLGDPKGRCLGELQGQADLVAFDYPDLDMLPRSRLRYLAVGDSGIPEPSRGDIIVFVGFPGAFRKSFGCRVNVSSMIIPLEVTDCSETTILAAAVGTNAEVFQDIDNRWGGFSGSLAYLTNDSGTFWPVGIVRDGSPLSGGCLQITRLTQLKPLLHQP
jgi:hypothetical protein